MKTFLYICAGLLFLGLVNLPIGYYTFLRIVITIGAIFILISEYKGELSIWIILFGIIAILFNPALPIYLNNKSAWTVIDLITGIIFIIKANNLKIKKKG